MIFDAVSSSAVFTFDGETAQLCIWKYGSQQTWLSWRNCVWVCVSLCVCVCVCVLRFSLPWMGFTSQSPLLVMMMFISTYMQSVCPCVCVSLCVCVCAWVCVYVQVHLSLTGCQKHLLESKKPGVFKFCQRSNVVTLKKKKHVLIIWNQNKPHDAFT